MQAAGRALFKALCAILIIGPAANAGADAALSIVTRNHQTKFQLGEVIPLDLSFTAATPGRFSMNLARYDRSGRMQWETFVVSPTAGTADPLAVYFKAFRAFLGGGLTNFQYLSLAPIQIHLQLNEWVRFDRPGTYRLSVISQRVADQQPGARQATPLELASNELTLEIVPADPAWQRAQLDRIRAGIALHPPAFPSQPDDDPRTAALAALRYLGTADAAREMAGLFRSADSNTEFQCMFGLIGSPSRADGLREMKRLLAVPDFPVDERFLSTMSLLSLDPDASSEELSNRREENLNQLGDELLRVLPQKTGVALAVSTNTALGLKQGPLSPEARQKVSEQIAAVFEMLPIDAKIGWLESRWEQVKGPEWIPLLRKIASEYKEFAIPNEMHAYQSLELSAGALKNWYQLDPEGARQAVIAEIERPRPRFSVETLGILPDNVLPEAEQVIAGHFVSTTDFYAEGKLAALLFRYADRDVLPMVLPKIEKSIGTWACEPQKNALAYLSKVDEDIATPLIERAIAARSRTGCWKSVLTELGSMHPASSLQEIAIQALYDPDAELATDAVNYLGRFGSAEAQPKLWQRFVDWSLVWKGRDAELRSSPIGPHAHAWDANLGQALVRALASGQGWFTDEQQLHQIRSLATESLQQEVDADLREAAERPVPIQDEGFTPPHFHVAQYEVYSLDDLKAKLKQFPGNTSFVFSAPVPLKDPSWLSDLKAWLKETGINVSWAQSPNPAQ